MHEVKVIEVGTYQVTHTIELTDEQWEDAVDSSTGLVTDVGLIAEEAFLQAKGGHYVCAQCSGWGQDFSLSLDEQTKITEITNVVSGNVIYEDNYFDEPEEVSDTQ